MGHIEQLQFFLSIIGTVGLDIFIPNDKKARERLVRKRRQTWRKVFHAGTALQDGEVVTAGGRVLCATALGNNVTEAQQKAYELLKAIQFKDVYYRTDIAHRAIAREAEAK